MNRDNTVEFLKQRQFSFVDQNFSWRKQIGHEFEQEENLPKLFPFKNSSQNQRGGSPHWSDRGNKKRFQYCTDSSGTIVYLRALSFITGQCDYSEQLLPVHISCRMCVQFAFYHLFWINTWRSKLEQQTDSILSACGSYGQKSQGS